MRASVQALVQAPVQASVQAPVQALVRALVSFRPTLKFHQWCFRSDVKDWYPFKHRIEK